MLLDGVPEFGLAGFAILQLELAHHAVFPFFGQVKVSAEVPLHAHQLLGLVAFVRILHFNLELSGPFGEPLKELPIRYHLLPKDLSPDAEPSDIIQTETSLTFRLGDAQFSYTRLGLERLKDD